LVIDLLAAFRADMQACHRAPETIRVYGLILRSYAAFLTSRGVALEAVKRADLKAYLDLQEARGIAHKTVSIRFGALASFYDFLVFDEIIDVNPVRAVQKRYLQTYKAQKGHTHRLYTVEEMAALVHEIREVRDKLLLVFALVTGARQSECLNVDVEDINFENQSVTLKATAKRSNRIVFFNDECEVLLRRWLTLRHYRNSKKVSALFCTVQGRMSHTTMNNALIKPATRLGLHDPMSKRLEDHFNAHCTRHWFTTMLDRAGMNRRHIQVLRGDVGGEAIDLYLHNDMQKIREEYLACVPRLGI
jgi:integrase/recombinase XerD